MTIKESDYLYWAFGASAFFSVGMSLLLEGINNKVVSGLLLMLIGLVIIVFIIRKRFT